jgi:hypothetical protein
MANKYDTILGEYRQNDYDSQLTKEPSGFYSDDGLQTIVVTYNQANRTITLNGNFKAYYRGVQIPELINGWVSDPHDEDPTTTLFLKYNSHGFEWSTEPWRFDEVQIAYACYRIDGAFCFAQREVHGLMPWQSHKEFHETIGTYRQSGGGLLDIVLQSTTATDRRPNVELTVIQDEDLRSDITALTSKAYTRCFANGTGKSEFDLDQAEIVNLTGNIPNYNQVTDGIGSQVPMDSGQTTRYMSVWIIAIPVSADTDSQKFRYLFKQGQSATSSLSEERTKNPQDLYLGDLEEISPEFVFTNQIILRYRGNPTNDWDIFEVRALTGNKFIQVGSPSGQYLSVVASDDTLDGNGTPTDPLSVTIGINDLLDVDDTGKETGKVLKYNEVSGQWEVADDNDTTYQSSDFDIKDLTDSDDLRTSWSGKQDSLGYTPEDVSNKKTTLTDDSDNFYPTQKAVKTAVDSKLNLNQSSVQTLTTSPIIDNLTATRIPFASATKTLTDSSALLWDSTNNRIETIGVASGDAGVLEAELVEDNWTSTGWTGSHPTFTNSAGNTLALSNSLAAITSAYYYINITVTGRTSGSFEVSFGGVTLVKSNATTTIFSNEENSIRAVSTGNLIITPTSTFNGSVTVSIKRVLQSTSKLDLKTSNGQKTLEFRSTNETLGDLFIGKDAGSRTVSNVGANVAIGARAFEKNISGQLNTVIGNQALVSNISGNQNTAIGRRALNSNTLGQSNVAIGSGVLFGNTTGSLNTGIGSGALFNQTTGSNNVAIGRDAARRKTNAVSGGNFTLGDKSLYIGYRATPSDDGVDEEIAIGADVVGKGSNTITIGGPSNTDTYIQGDLELLGSGKGIRLTSPDGLVTKTISIDNAGNLVLT